MRVLFVFEAGDGTIFPYVPLAQAVRGAGHEVLTATHAGAVPTLLTAGLPAVANADVEVVRTCSAISGGVATSSSTSSSAAASTRPMRCSRA